MDELAQSAEFRRTLNESARLLQQNRPGEALELLQPLYDQAPTQADVAINVGGAYILQRKWNRAVAVLSKAVEANPQNVMLWSNLAAAQLGDLHTAGPQQQLQAIAAYEQVLALDPQTPNIHYHLGLIYKERGELTRAMAFFQRALEVAPTDRDAQYWLERLAGSPLPPAPPPANATPDLPTESL
jgi:tetratricopeptide (TPR) repeat protein